MDIFEAYEMQDDALKEGVWAELILLGEKIGRIKVRPSDADLNLDYRRALAKAGEALLKIRADSSDNEISDDKNAELTACVYAETILTDWELLETKDGKEVPIKFSEKKAAELLYQLPKLLKATQDAARQWTKFRKSALSEAVKA